MKKFLTSALIALLALGASTSSMADDSERSLFINLTSREMNRAAMAIVFGHKVLTKKQMPVTIFLNVDGVHLANRNMPQNLHSSGKSLQEMLKGFMADGGRVIVCPMCMKNVGAMSEKDLIDGVVLGGPKTTWKALFADDVTEMSF